jgi:hypothetical protein
MFDYPTPFTIEKYEEIKYKNSDDYKLMLKNIALENTLREILFAIDKDKDPDCFYFNSPIAVIKRVYNITEKALDSSKEKKC